MGHGQGACRHCPTSCVLWASWGQVHRNIHVGDGEGQAWIFSPVIIPQAASQAGCQEPHLPFCFYSAVRPWQGLGILGRGMRCPWVGQGQCQAAGNPAVSTEPKLPWTVCAHPDHPPTAPRVHGERHPGPLPWSCHSLAMPQACATVAPRLSHPGHSRA